MKVVVKLQGELKDRFSNLLLNEKGKEAMEPDCLEFETEVVTHNGLLSFESSEMIVHFAQLPFKAEEMLLWSASRFERSVGFKEETTRRVE